MTSDEIKALLKDVSEKDLQTFIESNGFVSREYATRLRREKESAEEKVNELTGKYEDAVKYKTEAEKQKLAEEGKLKELLEQERNERATEAKKAEKALKDLKSGLIKSEARRVAKERGIIAEELVDVIDLSAADYDGGAFKGVVEAIDAHAKAKPHLFKAPETEDERKAREDAERKAKGTLAPPVAGAANGNGKVDWAKVDDKTFDAELERVKAGAGNISPLG